MRWFRFPAWVPFFVSGVTWSARRVALETLLAHVAWRHRGSSPLQSSNSWLRYGFGTVLDSLRWLVPRWASSGPARVGGRSCENGKRSFDEFHRVQKSQERRARARALARRFKLFAFGHRPQAAGPIRVSVWGGAPPTSRLALARHFFMWWEITFTHVLKLLSGLHIYNITTFVILRIHTILQPFIKV